MVAPVVRTRRLVGEGVTAVDFHRRAIQVAGQVGSAVQRAAGFLHQSAENRGSPVRVVARPPWVEGVNRDVVAIGEPLDRSRVRQAADVEAPLLRHEAFADQQDRGASRRGPQLCRQRAESGQHDLGPSRLHERRRPSDRFFLQRVTRLELPLPSLERRDARANPSRSVVSLIEVSGSSGLRRTTWSSARSRSATNFSSASRTRTLSSEEMWNSSRRIASRRGSGRRPRPTRAAGRHHPPAARNP